MSDAWSITINRLKYVLEKSERIGLICHKKPDADSVGSMLALMLALDNTQKKVTCLSSDTLPQSLSFLPQASSVETVTAQKIQAQDVLIALDCGDKNQAELDKYPPQKNTIVINIDHHGNDLFGHLNIIDKNASSTAEIVYSVLQALSIEITKDIATCILTGILGDTDNFKNPNTTKETLECTSGLLAQGVNLKRLGKNIYHNKSLTSLKLWGVILSRIRKHPTLEVVSTCITYDEMIEMHSTPEDIDGIANFLNSIPDTKASFILSELSKGEIKGSLRTMTKEVDVSRLAAFFGGGGHAKAAGFTIKGNLKTDGSKWIIQPETT